LEDIPIKLVYLTLFLFLIDLGQAQGLNHFLSQINRDEENPLPEDDIYALEYIENHFRELNPFFISQIEKMTFLDENDIQQFKSQKELSAISKKQLSNNGELFFEFIETLNKQRSIGDIHIKQYFTFKNDVQYRWTSRLNKENKAIGLLVERDAFETQALDHVGLYIGIKTDKGEIIVGDYQINHAYGLLLWRSVPVKKGIGSIGQLSRRGKGLRPYKSSHENWAIRGLAYQWGTEKGQFLVSIGYTDRDGSIDTLGSYSIYETGIHVSATELGRKDGISENSLIVNYEHTFKLGVFGLCVLYANLKDKGKNFVETKGQSIYFDSKIKQVRLFGEFALGHQNTSASYFGIKTDNRQFKYVAILRNYSPEYFSLRSNPSTEWSSKSAGERGIYQGFTFKLNRHRITFYNDLFRKQISTSIEAFPESGLESGIQYEWRASKTIVRVRFKTEKKTRSTPQFIGEVYSNNNLTNRYQATTYHSYAKDLKSKLQINITESNEDIGYGINYRLDKNWHQWNFIFDGTSSSVESFDARIYFWDVNLPGEMRSRMVSFSGHNLGFRFSYSNNSYRLSMRLSSTWKNLNFKIKPVVSSGLLLESFF